MSSCTPLQYTAAPVYQQGTMMLACRALASLLQPRAALEVRQQAAQSQHEQLHIHCLCNTVVVPTHAKQMRTAVQANRWLSLRLELLGITIVVATAALASLFLRGNPGLAGLALTSALNLTGFLNWFVRTSSELEVTTLALLHSHCHTSNIFILSGTGLSGGGYHILGLGLQRCARLDSPQA